MGFLITLADGTRVPFAEGGLTINSEAITGAKTLRTEDSGKEFTLSAANGAPIALPDVANGLRYKFTTGLAFDTSPWVITSTTNVISGSVTVAGVVVVGSLENSISFVESAEGLGDWIEIWSDGTNWYVSGQAAVTGAITLTVI